MTPQRPRLTPQHLRILGAAWFAIVLMVGACVFLAIYFGMNPELRNQVANRTTPTAATGADVPTPTQGLSSTATQPSGDTGAGAATPLPQATVPARQDPTFGYGIQVQAHMNTDQTLDQVNQLGLTWIKQQVRWHDLEPARGAANWDAMDTVFAETSERNIKVMVSVLAAPDWARSVTAEGKAGPPDNYQDYVNYVTQLVQRYPGAIHAVELWNEQNLEREWYTSGGLNAARYVEMAKLAAEAIHQVDPGVIVISGALAPTGVDDGQLAINDFRYMQEMIDAGLLDYVDCVGAHANGYNLPPALSAEDALAQGAPAGAVFLGPFDSGNPLNPHPSWSFYSTLTGYHEMIVAAGKDTPLCVTEFGWASVEGMDGNPRQSFEFAYDNTLAEQAENIVDAYQLMNDWDFVWLAFLFNLDYSPKAGGNTQDDTTMFSIQAPDGSPRPAYDAVRNMPKTP